MGTLKIWSTAVGLRRLDFRSGRDAARQGESLSEDPPPPHLSRALDLLRSYFAGEGTEFDLPLDLNHVTPFQLRVYERLAQIRYGQVITYGEIAEEIGEGRSAARAVGQAIGANPVAIIIPCHRVVSSDGSLHGYSGGLDRKAALLRLEGIQVDGDLASSKVHPEVLQLPL